MSAGDTVAFCRGGVFQSTSAWTNTSCRAQRPCHIRDYRAPWNDDRAPDPKFVHSGFGIVNPGLAKHKEGYRVSNLEIVGDGTGFGVVVNNDSKDILLCNLTVTNFDIGVYISGANLPDVGSDGLNARVVLRGSRVINNRTMGWLGTCDDCRIENNLFDRNGGANPFDHNIYLNGPNVRRDPHYLVKGMQIVGNELRHSSQGTGGVCMGNPLVVHGTQDHLTIRGNTIQEEIGAVGGGCWGISVAPGYAEGESFKNIVISGNRVLNVGNASIQMSSCEHCTIENNLIVQSQSAFSARGIVVHPGLRREPNDAPGTDVQVLNNTVYLSTPLESTGIVVGYEGRDYVVSGNLVVQAGRGHLDCFGFGLPATAFASDHNLCWNPQASATSWEARAGSLTHWQSTSGQDRHSVQRDPLLPGHLERGDGGFLPPANSPAAGAGDPRHSPKLDLRDRARGAAPDVGALQH
jgi:hypothetical protein